jgi:hypothetical protein
MTIILDMTTILSFCKHNVSRSASVSVIMSKEGKVLIHRGLLKEANFMGQNLWETFLLTYDDRNRSSF